MLVKFTESPYVRKDKGSITECLFVIRCQKRKVPRMNAKDKYQLFWFCVKTITSAPSRIVLVLKPLPSDQEAI